MLQVAMTLVFGKKEEDSIIPLTIIFLVPCSLAGYRSAVMSKTVFYIKLVHSILFFLILVSTIYVFVSALLDHITNLTWWAFGVAIVELLALALNSWRCPLTDLAEQQGAEVGSVADLFLPQWLSDHLFIIFGIVFSATCLLFVWRLLG